MKALINGFPVEMGKIGWGEATLISVKGNIAKVDVSNWTDALKRKAKGKLPVKKFPARLYILWGVECDD